MSGSVFPLPPPSTSSSSTSSSSPCSLFRLGEVGYSHLHPLQTFITSCSIEPKCIFNMSKLKREPDIIVHPGANGPELKVKDYKGQSDGKRGISLFTNLKTVKIIAEKIMKKCVILYQLVSSTIPANVFSLQPIIGDHTAIIPARDMLFSEFFKELQEIKYLPAEIEGKAEADNEENEFDEDEFLEKIHVNLDSFSPPSSTSVSDFDRQVWVNILSHYLSKMLVFLCNRSNDASPVFPSIHDACLVMDLIIEIHTADLHLSSYFNSSSPLQRWYAYNALLLFIEDEKVEDQKIGSTVFAFMNKLKLLAESDDHNQIVYTDLNPLILSPSNSNMKKNGNMQIIRSLTNDEAILNFIEREGLQDIRSIAQIGRMNISTAMINAKIPLKSIYTFCNAVAMCAEAELKFVEIPYDFIPTQPRLKPSSSADPPSTIKPPVWRGSASVGFSSTPPPHT